MPRKAKSRSSQPATPEPQVQTIRMLEQDPNLSPIGRDDNGRFARGNAGGPGNPHARHCARVLAFFRNVIDDEKIEAIIHVLYARAVAGDMSAIKLILSYKIGKPAPAPNPDGIERDEWNRLEEAAVQHQAVDDLLHLAPQPPRQRSRPHHLASHGRRLRRQAGPPAHAGRNGRRPSGASRGNERPNRPRQSKST